MPCINCIQEIIKEFENKVDCIVDCGDATFKIPSTIVRVENEEIIILRDGPLTKEKIEKQVKGE